MIGAGHSGRYYHHSGWKRRAIVAVESAAIFSFGAVCLAASQALSGFGWLFGAMLGRMLYILFSRRN